MSIPPVSRMRRQLLAAGTLAGLGGAARAAGIELPIVNDQRNLVAFPEKRPLIVLTPRPPQLETPFEVFNEGILTPNDAFFVRYHNAGLPTAIDGDKHLIKIGGNAAGKPFEISVADLKSQFKPIEVVAVNHAFGWTVELADTASSYTQHVPAFHDCS